jgi:branched-chain amino acid transport system substrate-binding protein
VATRIDRTNGPPKEEIDKGVFDAMGFHLKHLVHASALASTLLAAMSGEAAAQKSYDIGATDTEIRLGNSAPYSGPASAYSVIVKAESAYFKMINDRGGINGRNINFISYDDAYSPPKTVEQTRKLVESDEVLAIVGTVGTPGNSAVQKYLNGKKVPQLLAMSGADKWADPKQFPWTMGFLPSYRSEAKIYAQYVLGMDPNARIGVLYQNDDFGKECVAGLKEGLGEKAKDLIVIEVPFETSAPTIESEISRVKASGATVLMSFATSKFAAQAIKRSGELGWKVTHIVSQVATSIAGVIKPAGFDNAQGVLSSYYLKDPADPQWKDDPDMVEWRAFMDKYLPDADKGDSFYVGGYAVAQVMVQILAQCGDNLTRENVMKQAANLDMLAKGMLPGIRVKTSSNDYRPVEQLQIMQFSGEQWRLIGSVLGGNGKSM